MNNEWCNKWVYLKKKKKKKSWLLRQWPSSSSPSSQPVEGGWAEPGAGLGAEPGRRCWRGRPWPRRWRFPRRRTCRWGRPGEPWGRCTPCRGRPRPRPAAGSWRGRRRGSELFKVKALSVFKQERDSVLFKVKAFSVFKQERDSELFKVKALSVFKQERDSKLFKFKAFSVFKQERDSELFKVKALCVFKQERDSELFKVKALSVFKGQFLLYTTQRYMLYFYYICLTALLLPVQVKLCISRHVDVESLLWTVNFSFILLQLNKVLSVLKEETFPGELNQTVSVHRNVFCTFGSAADAVTTSWGWNGNLEVRIETVCYSVTGSSHRGSFWGFRLRWRGGVQGVLAFLHQTDSQCEAF